MVEQIKSKAAFTILCQDKDSFLIDVRTNEELTFVGVVQDKEFKNKMISIQWLTYPHMEENPEFLNQLEDIVKNKEAKIFFICRTGARSNNAAQFCQNIGYKNCFNIINGFEGDLNGQGQRGLVNGWKASNLLWRQN